MMNRFFVSGMFHYQHWQGDLLILCAFVLSFGLFLFPGFAVAVSLPKRRTLSPVYLVVVVIATAAALGYVSFWIFFASRTAGKTFTFLLYGLASVSTVRSFFGQREGQQIIRQIAAPFLLALLAGICYLSLFYLFGDPANHGAGLANVRFSESDRPGDNIIPLIFAERLYNHEPLRPFCCGDWLSSDRPPLQSGIFLLQQPLRLVSIGVQYQLLGTALQCLWVCGAWCLLRALGAAERRIRQVLPILILSGFFFYNSVYVWPKLLAAACLLLALSVLLGVVSANRPATRFDTVLMAACLGLALMAHPGSAFSLPALGVVFLRYRRLFLFRVLGLGVLGVLTFIAPWSAYGKWIDPPGNRLPKMHLAGQYKVDSHTAWQAISDAYRARSFEEILHLKWSNVRELAGHQPLEPFSFGKFIHRDLAVHSRIAQREWIWNALGLLNLGWFAGLGFLLQRRSYTTAIPHSRWLLAAALFNFLVWSFVMFGPNATVTTHSSYADIILLSLGLCGFLLALPGRAVLIVFGLQICNLLVVWAWFPPVASFPQGKRMEAPFLISGSAALLGLLWIFARACPTQSLEPLDPAA